MKKNDENQNNDSGMTRRVYKKASLDDTVVNVRKDPSDDFDLLSDDGMILAKSIVRAITWGNKHI